VDNPEPEFERIASGLARTRADSDEARAIISYVAGALFGLRRAHALGYRDEADSASEKTRRSELASVAEALKSPYNAPSQEWTASWYFNSALHRIDAADARLSGLTRLRRRDQRDAPAGTVARDAGHLKHRPRGLAEGRTVTFGNAIAELARLAESLETHFNGLANKPLQPTSGGTIDLE
jgi:hypothetical protein